MFKQLIQTNNSKSILLIRIMVGVVFLSEGIQKFIFPALRGVGRFEKIGLPNPEILGNLIGGIEIICGVLILVGFITRLGSFFTFMIMLTALATTKFTILQNDGFWVMMHASRTDFAMLLGSLFLLINGGGLWSMDYINTKKVS
ncbi:DoxX family protein [Flammeovirga pectinis]|uniref:DoxX family protein n=1 Tax=Flammeovirga pectinis TaxID=2494373 RepID=A0A3S9P0Z2_9BACT|nr:DoxX family protein [Flammeovirga pectinis]AZQ61864.1 DoxX family protein [Flammeovirga pectinis]